MTSQIILHHAAANCTPQEIHKWHLNNGWAGIGYHFVIAKDGCIFRGRAENWIGSHASGNNSNSIGICFVGNFENENLSDEQKQAGKELIAFLRSKYGNIMVKGHRDVNPTSCPGRNFPMGEFSNVSAGGSTNSTSQNSNNGTGLLKIGSRGEEVKKLQHQLIKLGYDLGQYAADGVFGEKTEKAIRDFQNKNGLSVDGVVGNQTRSALNSVKPQSPQSENNNNYPGYLIKQGQKGDIVKKFKTGYFS